MFTKFPKLIGENLAYGGNVLYMDFIPQSTKDKNLRKIITQTSWDKIRKYVYERANHKCECCSAVPPYLQAHERFSFDLITKIQKIERIMALCKKCHLATHMDHTIKLKLYPLAKKHIMSVRGWNQNEYYHHYHATRAEHKTKNQIQWVFDKTFISQNNLKVQKKILAEWEKDTSDPDPNPSNIVKGNKPRSKKILLESSNDMSNL